MNTYNYTFPTWNVATPTRQMWVSTNTTAPKESRKMSKVKDKSFSRKQERRALALCAAQRVAKYSCNPQTFHDELLYIADYLVHGERNKRKRRKYS